MPSGSSTGLGWLVPLTEAEKTRMVALLATVSTRTLLRSLARFYVENEDAELILATLLDRFPFDERQPQD